MLGVSIITLGLAPKTWLTVSAVVAAGAPGMDAVAGRGAPGAVALTVAFGSLAGDALLACV